MHYSNSKPYLNFRLENKIKMTLDHISELAL